MFETAIFNNISLRLSPFVILFRNQQGMAIFKDDKTGKKRFIPYGVGPKGGGGSDSIGWTSKTITPDMVGKKVAIFTAIEIKTLEGSASEAQKNFIEQVIAAGGYGGFASTTEDAKSIVNL